MSMCFCTLAAVLKHNKHDIEIPSVVKQEKMRKVDTLWWTRGGRMRHYAACYLSLLTAITRTDAYLSRRRRRRQVNSIQRQSLFPFSLCEHVVFPPAPCSKHAVNSLSAGTATVLNRLLQVSKQQFTLSLFRMVRGGPQLRTSSPRPLILQNQSKWRNEESSSISSADSALGKSQNIIDPR